MKLRVPIRRPVEITPEDSPLLWCAEQPWWSQALPLLQAGCSVMAFSSRPPPSCALDPLVMLVEGGGWTGRLRVVFPDVAVPMERQASTWGLLALPPGSDFPDTHIAARAVGFSVAEA